MDLQSLHAEIARLDSTEQRVIERFVRRHRPSRVLGLDDRTFSERLADRVAAFGGSWPFIFLALAAIAVWMAVNQVRAEPFDPYPYILLNLVLSCLAALQGPIIMMSQNRQADRDRQDAQHDYEVNTKAELEIVALHAKLDEQRTRLDALLKLLQTQAR